MATVKSLSCLLFLAITVQPMSAIAETYTIPFSEIRQAVETSGDSPDDVIRAYFAGLLREELDTLGFDVDGGIVLDDIPLDAITERISDDCDFPRPYEIHTDATTAVVEIDDNSSLTVDLDSIRSITLQADLSGTASAAANAWVRWGQDVIFVGDCVKINTDHGWVGLNMPFDIHLDLALELNPRYDSELLAIVVDKYAVLSGQAEMNGGNIAHDFGSISPTDLLINVFEDELLQELRDNGELAVADAIAGLNFRLDGLDANGLPDPGIEAFNQPTIFALDISEDDQPFIRDLLAQYGIPDIVIAMLDDRGIEVLLQLAILSGAEREAYLAELGATASCDVLLAAFETPLARVPVYSLNGQNCEVSDPHGPAAGAYFSDAMCLDSLAYRNTENADFCLERFGEQAESLLGNASAWLADTDQPNDPLPAIRSRSWTTIPSTQLDLGAVALAGNHQPYMKQLGYKTVSNVTRGSGTCELEMRVYKKDIGARNLKPVIALHGGTWEHRGFSFFGLEAGISHLTERGFIVFAPFYRLVGESDGNIECNAVGWHEVTEDVESALDWVAVHGSALGAANSRINVYGQSAGAHLAAWLAAHRPADVRKALLFYGPIDALDFLTGALSTDGSYQAFRSFGVKSLTRFFGAKDLAKEVRLEQIDFSALTVELLMEDWSVQIPDSVFDLSQVDPSAPPVFVARCAESTRISLSAVNFLAPPSELVACMKQDLSEFLIDNSFTHLLRDEAVPIHIVHGTADTLVPHQQAFSVCGAMDNVWLPTEIRAPLTTFTCGLSSQIQIIEDAEHALELGVCLDSICPAGQFGSTRRAAVETAINAAFDWLVTAPLVSTDSDGDGIPDHQDAFPHDPLESVDTDADGIGNNADFDDDGDGRPDLDDAFSSDPAEHLDTDGDGSGNFADIDDDNDGIPDADDNCPVVPNGDQPDDNENGIGNACDPQFATVTELSDVNYNGTADLALLHQDRNTGEYVVHVRDGSTARLISALNFGTDTAVSMQVIADSNNNGSPEIAVLAVRPSGQTRVQLRDSVNGAWINDIFYSAGFWPEGMTALPDSDGDGAAEIAVLAARNSDGRIAAEVRNVIGPEMPRIVWFAANHTALAIAAIPGDVDNDGVAELAVLSSRNSDGRNIVEIRNSSGAANPRTMWLMPGTSAIGLTVLGGMGAAGIPRIAILSSRNSDGRALVQIKNALGASVSSNLWIAAGHTARSIRTVEDADGNGEMEVAVLSSRNTDGRVLVEVKNASGAINSRQIWYWPGFTANGLVILADTNNDNIDEAAVLLTRDSDGRFLVQGRNAAGVAASMTYWF